MKNESQDQNLAALPRSHEAEQAVLGGLMLANDEWDNIAEILSEADFYLKVHRVIYREMGVLVKQNFPIDLITLTDSLRGKGLEQACGGFGYIAELSKNTPSAANIHAYANLVRETAIKREILAVVNEVASETMQPRGRTAKELLDLAESRVMGISEVRAKSQTGPSPISAILGSTIERLDQLFHTPHDGITGLDTGYNDLNKKNSRASELRFNCDCGAAFDGENHVCNEHLRKRGKQPDKPVLIFSLEMPKEQLMMRMLASLGRVDQTHIRTGMLDDDEWQRIAATSGVLLERDNIHIDDTSGLTPTELRSRARRLHRECGGLSLIMVDYLQLMRVPEIDSNRTLEIAEITRSLKSPAKELQLPVIALSQLNRSLEARADKRPLNSDLRESGSIEQDADVIMFIYRDEVYNERSEDKGIAEIIIGKQRNGPIGTVRLTFNGQWSRFDNYAGIGSDD